MCSTTFHPTENGQASSSNSSSVSHRYCVVSPTMLYHRHKSARTIQFGPAARGLGVDPIHQSSRTRSTTSDSINDVPSTTTNVSCHANGASDSYETQYNTDSGDLQAVPMGIVNNGKNGEEVGSLGSLGESKQMAGSSTAWLHSSVMEQDLVLTLPQPQARINTKTTAESTVDTNSDANDIQIEFDSKSDTEEATKDSTEIGATSDHISSTVEDVDSSASSSSNAKKKKKKKKKKSPFPPPPPPPQPSAPCKPCFPAESFALSSPSLSTAGSLPASPSLMKASRSKSTESNGAATATMNSRKASAQTSSAWERLYSSCLLKIYRNTPKK